MKTSKTMDAAIDFVTTANSYGWHIVARDVDRTSGCNNVVTIRKYFTAGSREEFVKLDGEYFGILSLLKARGGSMWGTDGSGVGGHSAMLHGVFTMNVSGVSSRMIDAVHKAMDLVAV